ncbi:mechanosensitive ion channel family protein [Synechococcus sp. CCY9201]|uniref:mechanosensitive ion channel family protein n=1 Tax=unclassified Synechococcus TaxID=2626047 RepID=UPI001E3E9DE5|nr:MULTISPECIES: mechanosensitive ion channel family protein [unclassified Synechococcus]MEA5423425.1 mechanosensitive ion channel family protein [Synechococcus sp. CCY9202]MEA5475221.1 mechanosensitive ion channel family protein [Synechococcus sp. CCY9201]CAK6699675.1 hypothetical protein IFHNHDMJ_02687 [Synechococcus sp. CBW1107]
MIILPFDLGLLLSGLLLAVVVWIGMDQLARLARPSGLARRLLLRARLSVSLTIGLGTLIWWGFERLGWDLSRNGSEVRQVVLILGLVWTVLRCKSALLAHAGENLEWLQQRSQADRNFLQDLLNKLITGTLLLLATLEVLRLMGVSPTLLLTASGFGAAALGFGARTLVENLLGGVMLYVNRPFVIGDFIQVPSQSLQGTVKVIGLYYTQLITPDQQPLYLPNATFASSAILNGARRDHRQVLVTFGIRYDDQPLLEPILSALREELTQCPGVEPSLPRRVHFVGYGESSLDLRLECFGGGSSDAYYELQQEILQRIGRVVASQGAAMPFPTRLVLQTKPQNEDPQESSAGAEG